MLLGGTGQELGGPSFAVQLVFIIALILPLTLTVLTHNDQSAA